MESKLLFILTLFAGLMAGLFYAWSISVTPGFAKVSDKSYLESFQSMNRAILNPVFFIPFMGLALLLPLASYLMYSSPQDAKFWFVLASTGLYLIGIMGVTIFGNVPLNDQLEALNISKMDAEQMAQFRSVFEAKWNALNWIRTAVSSLVMALLVAAINQ